MADQRRSSSSARPPRSGAPASRTPAAPLTGPIQLDEATANALHLFNARLEAQAENERAERRVQKAIRAKDEAAAKVRALENDPKATATDRAAAAAAYRESVEAVDRARTGEPTPAGATEAVEAVVDTEPEAEPTAETAAEPEAAAVPEAADETAAEPEAAATVADDATPEPATESADGTDTAASGDN